jgi:beta-galactosidase
LYWQGVNKLVTDKEWFMNKKQTFLSINVITVLAICCVVAISATAQSTSKNRQSRERINIDSGWKFMRYTSSPDKLMYDERPEVTDRNDSIAADTKPTEAVTVFSSDKVLRKWILPTANDFIADPAKHYTRPQGNPGEDFPFVKNDFNDHVWEAVNLPHDWAIKGPFYDGGNAIVSGGMGRLPIQGVAWYRRKIGLNAADKNKNIYLDIDGAMSYAMVWCNGTLVGGWPYGYNSFRLDLTPFLKPGNDNQIAIRIDNPNNSSRWYPGAGLYRNVWLTKVNAVHVAQWGTVIQTRNVGAASATVDLAVWIENKSGPEQKITTSTNIYLLDSKGNRSATAVAVFTERPVLVQTGGKQKIESSIRIKDPLLWGPLPDQKPNLYTAITKIYSGGKELDTYETVFGIRSITMDPAKGIAVNGKPLRIQGVNQHHDLGALGAAFNRRAAERQLEMLRELGCNAIRFAHNPPAPELLDLTDKMGFLVIDEIFDIWERKKTPLDFHLIFPDWYEADTRAFIRRDKNHPSIIAWSFGNEVGEQYTEQAGADLAKKLHDIVWDEDSTRPATASMNYAKPDMPFPQGMDIISLNYQGEGVRDGEAYAKLNGIRTSPLYPSFQKKFPGKLIISTETSSTLSTRGTYLFPVVNGNSAPAGDKSGGDAKKRTVSAYELYTAPFGSSPDKVFGTQDRHPYVAGEFVWSGWDYIGEPTPFYSARSSYFGIIDLAGFKKDRFYLYQSRWRPELRLAHILPHWTWPDRNGQITPVHVFSSGDEAELFLNDVSLGRKKKMPYEYRFRWDSVVYSPGVLRIVTYKKGKLWAKDTVCTAGDATTLELKADRKKITPDGEDLSFITVRVMDAKGVAVPEAANKISFEITGPGEIVATDNGDPASMVSFASHQRETYSGMALVVVRYKKGATGTLTIKAISPGLKNGVVEIKTR